MRVLVKICGLKDATAVAAAVAAGADAIGFVFAKSVRQVTPAEASELATALPGTVRRVAVMLHPGAAEWQAVLDAFQPDVLQTDAMDFASLDVPDSVERWPVFREGGAVVDSDGPFVYEGARSGHGETVNWTQAATLATSGKLILAGGLSADNVADAILKVRPMGVDVSSGVETAPGQKGAEKIAAFINAVRTAEKDL